MPTPVTLGFVLHDAARLMRKRFEQRSRHTGLTRSQWHVLAILSKNEGIHQKGLADLMEIESITLVRLLDKMQERNLIERRPHPSDRRATQLFVTPEAIPLLDVLRGLGNQTRTEALGNFTDEEQHQLFDLLSRMREHLIDACNQPVDAVGEIDHV
ncbi:MarR family transcriptional regulator [Pseudomonas asiatica]|uniref:MarR family winged helix-turn-helix transcriptional regulator n=1 Tax=Pseudomonas asiatica TaxID=2219225 RepID=UPI002E7B67FB|nr:MarR family transcriptional regulator [Pseudomonas asiatica]MEE1916318.1 MarR family transcriptional regulator [Pseudomonas asiatica]